MCPTTSMYQTHLADDLINKEKQKKQNKGKQKQKQKQKQKHHKQ